MKKCETKSFIILTKESIISKLFKIVNHKENIGNKKSRTETITPSVLASFQNELSVLF